eukprot:CAMPEP_0178985210 /NCGR_PEP_ID=MMETSP0795-20121207/2027_1 /TAXON_ID=88552 /ORGANISM="Amoebophrya sp., Strain Ameob2" /LENGTH=757 /DNA_ID=CAMNT_0020676145 /DNA_START=129 /DNA_END=2406 /DNA_ORIENTATION=+
MGACCSSSVPSFGLSWAEAEYGITPGPVLQSDAEFTADLKSTASPTLKRLVAANAKDPSSLKTQSNSKPTVRLLFVPVLGEWARDFPGTWMLMMPVQHPDRSVDIDALEKFQAQSDRSCAGLTYAFGPMPFFNHENIKNARHMIPQVSFKGLAFPDNYVPGQNEELSIVTFEDLKPIQESMEILCAELERKLKKNPAKIPALDPWGKRGCDLAFDFANNASLHANRINFLGKFHPALLPFGHVHYKGKICVAPANKGRQLLREQERIGCALGSVLSGMLHTKTYMADLMLTTEGWELAIPLPRKGDGSNIRILQMGHLWPLLFPVAEDAEEAADVEDEEDRSTTVLGGANDEEKSEGNSKPSKKKIVNKQSIAGTTTAPGAPPGYSWMRYRSTPPDPREFGWIPNIYPLINVVATTNAFSTAEEQVAFASEIFTRYPESEKANSYMYTKVQESRPNFVQIDFQIANGTSYTPPDETDTIFEVFTFEGAPMPNPPVLVSLDDIDVSKLDPIALRKLERDKKEAARKDKLRQQEIEAARMREEFELKRKMEEEKAGGAGKAGRANKGLRSPLAMKSLGSFGGQAALAAREEADGDRGYGEGLEVGSDTAKGVVSSFVTNITLDYLKKQEREAELKAMKEDLLGGKYDQSEIEELMQTVVAEKRRIDQLAEKKRQREAANLSADDVTGFSSRGAPVDVYHQQKLTNFFDGGGMVDAGGGAGGSGDTMEMQQLRLEKLERDQRVAKREFEEGRDAILSRLR